MMSLGRVLLRAACLIALLASVVCEEDLYKILGIGRDATPRQIKKAYRKLSRQYHPDKNIGDDAAATKFQEIANAYEILSDEESKFLYDDGGMEAVKGNEQGGGMSPFDSFFGGGQREKRSRNKGPDLQYNMDVSLVAMFNGADLTTQIERLVHCKGCKGKNSAECRKCTTRCPNEIKMVNRQIQPGFVVQQQQEVRSQEKCKMEPITLDVTIEKGMKDGDTLKFEGKSEQPPGKFPGDVIITMKQEKHDIFTRHGDDLAMEMDISLKESLVGFKRTVTHLNGEQFLVQSEKITKPYSVKTIRDEGMPVHNFASESGKLKVTFNVVFPRTLTATQKNVAAEVLP